MNYTFAFSVEDINLILSGLQELPHKVSNALITRIVNEADSQNKAAKVRDSVQAQVAGADAALDS